MVETIVAGGQWVDWLAIGEFIRAVVGRKGCTRVMTRYSSELNRDQEGMPRMQSLRPRFVSCSVAFALLCICMMGCGPDDGASNAVSTFQQASATLEQAYETLINNANLVEENHYIDGEVFKPEKFTPNDLRSVDIMTPEEIKLRVTAIKALSDYTVALATLAAGKPGASIEADANSASASLKTLTTDLGTALKTPSSETAKIAGPISAAVAAAGEVVQLIERRRGESEIQASLAKNDPTVLKLFQAMETEASDLYARQKSALGDTGVQLFADYDRALGAKTDAVQLLQLSDRIKQYEASEACLNAADPTAAITAFQKAHDALTKLILAPKVEKKQSLADVIASVKSFAAEVTPLAQDLGNFAKTV